MTPEGDFLDMADAVANMDFSSVARVAQRATLEDVRLAWSQVGVFTDYLDVEADWPLRASGWYKSYPVGGADPVTSPISIRCDCALHYFAGVDSTEDESPPEASEENPPTLAVEAAFVLVYRLTEADRVSPSDLNHFSAANGTHNAWPYWREYAQSVTLRMGVTPYVVPPFKLPSPDDPQPVDPDERSGEDPSG